MEIRHLRYFIAVADTLSFAKAAEQLHMSQPPLSQRIADIEQELGIRLFDRSTRKVSLTDAAATFLPEARAAVEAFDAAIRAMRAASASKSRRVRIATPTETARGVLTDVIEVLDREKVEVQFVEASTSEQLRLLSLGEIDVGVLRHPFDEHGLKFLPPLGQQLGVLMSSSHPLASRAKLRLQDLEPYPLVHFERHWAPGFYDEILESCREGGYVPSRIFHGVRLTAPLLISQNAVTFSVERQLKRRGATGSGELTWKPLVGSPVKVWTSVVCRQSDRDGVAKLAMAALQGSLQKNESWEPMPRPDADQRSSTKRARKNEH